MKKKKEGGEGWELGTFFCLFNAPLLAIYNIMQSSMICNTVFKECIYWIPYWCWVAIPTRKEPDSAALFESNCTNKQNNQTLLTFQQAGKQR